MYQRPDKETYYLRIADVVSERATCLRRRYGAIIVKSGCIIGTGYCGSARGEPNCCDRGICKREELGAKRGERYELCVSVHAEQNSIIPVESEKLKGSTMYIYGRDVNTGLPVNSEPCMMCWRVIKNAQIKEVVYFDGENVVHKVI